MNISVKSRYALCALTYLGSYADKIISTTEIANKFSISKVYLEQVFAVLKQANLISSIKGPNGGYKLSKKPKNISIFHILKVFESGLFAKNESTINDEVLETIITKIVYDKIDKTIKNTLENITLQTLIDQYNQNKENYIFYI